jgi:Ca-activated chloride channel homolog
MPHGTGMHFLHPAWLLALPLLWAACVWLAHRQRRSGEWSRAIAPELLPALRLAGPGRGASPWWLLGLAWTLATLAMAGPAWRQQTGPAWRAPANWVALLDLSPSMQQADPPPHRVDRARYAIADLLDAARDARVGLVAFAGEAHTVAPLTSDVATVRMLLAPLSPALMPESGDQLAPALDEAGRLLASAGKGHGQVVVYSDGFDDPAQALKSAQRLHAAGATVNVVGVGTPGGARGDELARVAAVGGGDYVPLAQADTLVARLLDDHTAMLRADARRSELEVDAWRNGGFWLLPPLLLLAAGLARRGWT